MVTDTGGLGDRSFNDASYAGLLAARQRLGVHAILLQSRSVVDFAANLGLPASRGYGLTIAIGDMLERDVADAARRFPRSRFAIVDGSVDAANVTAVAFREQEASFLAGALAALTTRTRTIGFLGGIDTPELRKFEAGYRAGARTIDPSVDVLVKYIGSYDDVAGGREIAALMYAAHADILFAAAGKAGLGAIDESKRRPATYVIGVDSDQDAIAPGKILTSVLKRLDRSVLRLCAQAQAGTLRTGRVSLGLKEDGVGLTAFRYSRRIVTAKTIARVAHLRAQIVNGAIVVPFTRAGLAAFNATRDRPDPASERGSAQLR